MAQPAWNTPQGSVGTYPANIPFTKIISAAPIFPATEITYKKISGTLPNGVLFNSAGLLYGSPETVITETLYTFVVRATDNQNNITDRTFTIGILGSALPKITTPPGLILTTNDSVWTEKFIEYENPNPNNIVKFRIVTGELPIGLEMNQNGVIRGYPAIPYLNQQLIESATSIVSCENNILSALTTADFTVERPIFFTGSTFGGLIANKTYYVQSILSNTEFTISEEINGPTVALSNDTGYMDATLPAITYNRPTVRNYTFTVALESELGNDLQTYNIIILNQNLPIQQGGSGYPGNTRIPTILNTRPEVFDTYLLPNSGYYLFPDNTIGNTYSPTDYAYLGQFKSGDFFSFRIIGKDFDNDGLQYNYVGLPLGLVGDSITGFITGTPTINSRSIDRYSFSVFVNKLINQTIVSKSFNFSLKISNELLDTIDWLTGQNLGTIFNGATSTLKVIAEAEVDLKYRVVDGALPPNLVLLENGEISGQVAWQPTDTVINKGTSTNFVFTIEAFSTQFAIIKSTKIFNITVLQEFEYPTDNLYIRATPSLGNRQLLNTLLNNPNIIPTEYLYRPTDPRFGKATNVVYAHAYGINASSFDEYIEAVTRNHYWRKITLGSISTAQAKDENGNILYEVVYSNVIDNLVNPQGQSVPENVIWPRKINLFKGPWYSSVTNIYTSYIFQPISENQYVETEEDLLIFSTEKDELMLTEKGKSTYVTSLTPGYVRSLYPNSLPNMRNRVGQVLGEQTDYRLLPAWMTSQQPNGNTLGFTPAWVICYTKPGFSTTIKNNINTLWVNQYNELNKLNQINFQIDRFTVDKSLTFNYDKNLLPNTWLDFPGASPPPNPIDSDNFYVLFPRKTILPNTPQSY